MSINLKYFNYIQSIPLTVLNALFPDELRFEDCVYEVCDSCENMALAGIRCYRKSLDRAVFHFPPNFDACSFCVPHFEELHFHWLYVPKLHILWLIINCTRLIDPEFQSAKNIYLYKSICHYIYQDFNHII